MAGSLEVQVLSEDELAPVLTRCAEEGHLLDGALRDTAPPENPGVYVGQASGLVVCIGEAAALNRRLTDELGWVCGDDPGEQRWEDSVVHLLRVYRALPR